MRVNEEYLSSDTYLATHRVELKQNHGMRLDLFLKERLNRRSRTSIQSAIQSGKIAIRRCRHQGLNSPQKIKPSTTLYAGDFVTIRSIKKAEPQVSFNIRTIFEDEAILVIHKPAPLPVHPAGRYFFNTLLHRIRLDGKKVYLVHRIDKETSGILVMAKTLRACSHLVHQFIQRNINKEYLAICHGNTPSHFTVNLPIRRCTNSLVSLKMTTTPRGGDGQTAETAFEKIGKLLWKNNELSLLKCFPKTGRQHQIRVHLNAMGHTIVGDKLYGLSESESYSYFETKELTPTMESKLILTRHALHAFRIEMIHPTAMTKLVFQTEMPVDFVSFLTHCDLQLNFQNFI